MYLYSDNNSKKIIGSIIKLNRVRQNLSQKDLAKGICVPSYLSRIENGELSPSEDVLSIIFNRLGLVFNDSEDFIKEGKSKFELFFKKLNFNEFDFTNTIFDSIESNEDNYITSPLIIDYFLTKLARYSCTPNRSKFEDTKSILLSSFELLLPNQKYIYDFYVGIDLLIYSKDSSRGKKFIEDALLYQKNGHCYFWLSYAYRIENNTIKAYDCIKKALDFYLLEGNILSIMDSYEKLAEVYFMLDNYKDAISYLDMSLNLAMKFNNTYFIEHLNSMLAWTYFRLGDFDTSLKYINSNTGVIDHRMVIPDSVIECLIYFTTNNKDLLKKSISKLSTPQTLEHIDNNMVNLLSKLFTFYLENDNYLKTSTWEELLLPITNELFKLVELKKFFTSLLKSYYIYNRKYKDALYL